MSKKKSRMSLSSLRECDVIASFVGITPKYDSYGRIAPVGRPSKNGKVYVVFRGRAIGLFGNWGMCKAMVAGYSATAYKAYSSLAEAREGWEEGPVSFQPHWRPPQPRPPEYTTHPPPASQGSSDSATYAASECADIATSNEATQPPDQATPVADQAKFTLAVPEPVLVDMTADHDFPRAPSPSPSISSISSVSSVSASSEALTDATISARTIDTPVLPLPRALPDDSDSPPFRRERRESRTPTSSRAREGDPGMRDKATGRVTYHEDVRTPPMSSPVREGSRSTSPRTPTQSSQKKDKSRVKGKFAYDKVTVSEPKEIFVVVRGENPGIYFDRPAALIMLGRSPGMKLAVFDSLSRAAWYFVKQYMAKQVGVPVLKDDDDDQEGSD